MTQSLANMHLARLLRTNLVINIIPRRFATYFTKDHEWISLPDENDLGRVGITNHAQEALGDVVYVQLPNIGQKFGQFEEVGAIESVKAASELLMPVSGKVCQINERLAKEPSLINSDCYKEGWLFDIKIEDHKELNNLMSEDKYEEFLANDDKA